MAETIVLDPSEVAGSRTEVDITSFIKAEGVDWGDAAIEAYMADAQYGSLPVDFDVPNRVVTIPLALKDRGAVTFDTIRRQLQAKVGLFQREGGWLKRLVGSTPLFLDVQSARLRLGGDTFQARASAPFDIGAVLVLECTPDFYGAEVDLGLTSETTNPEIVYTETGIDGDYPGRVRMVVTDAQGQRQLGLLWGFRARHYDSAASAALKYAATALEPLDAAVVSGSVVEHTSVPAGWTSVLGTNIGGTTWMTHVGTYRVWATMAAPDVTPGDDDRRVRFVWDVGDLVHPVQNASATVPGGGDFYLVDLGEIRLDRTTTSGTHRWQGHIQCNGTAQGASLQIKRVWFQPVDDGCGRLMAPVPLPERLAAASARDSFTGTTAGNALNGRTPPVGAAWVTAGAATDFVFADEGDYHEIVTRTATGVRVAVLGAAMTDQDVEATVIGLNPASAGTPAGGVICRYADTSNYLRLELENPGTVNLVKRVAGVETTLATDTITNTGGSPYDFKLRLLALASGVVIGQVNSSDGVELLRLTTSDTTIATGGALASGKGGIYHDGTMTWGFDDVVVRAAVVDAVLHPNQSLELRTDGAAREDSSGTAYGPVSQVIGVLPRIPVSGLEGRIVEVFVKASRGDLGSVPDGGNADDINCQLFYRPCWLFTGE